MKKQRIILYSGLITIIFVLSGCGAQNGDLKKEPAITPVKKEQAQQVSVSSEKTLPETVSKQPGKTVDEEIENINNDLKSIDDTSLTTGMSDSELGL